MKDITKLKFWPLLEKEGFQLKEFRTNGKSFGRGAILMPDYKKGFPYMEIKPLLNGHWNLHVDYFNSASDEEGSPSIIGKALEQRLIEFKEHGRSHIDANN